MSTLTPILRDFVRLNPPIFLVYKVGENPQEFLNGVKKVFNTMGVTFMEKDELSIYRFK